MRYIFCIIFLSVSIFAEDFITKDEHARMLYKNPRGIGCDKCHGEDGRGKLLSTYKHYDKKQKKLLKKSLITPPINDIEFSKFKQAIEKPKGVMPSYFLTNEEIKLLYAYTKNLLEQENNKPKKGRKNDK
ncbi:MAG: cytochrome c [Campylobacter sp.]|nr:cytochrome c [Campylobacter sp.]